MAKLARPQRMRQILQFTSWMLLSFSLGLHWTALQSVAWTSMFLNRVQHTSVAEALQTTFDGKHPCPICLAVRDGRSAERQPSAPAAGFSVMPKLEAAFPQDLPPLVGGVEAVRPPVPSSTSFGRRSERPPLPPPRHA